MQNTGSIMFRLLCGVCDSSLRLTTFRCHCRWLYRSNKSNIVNIKQWNNTIVEQRKKANTWALKLAEGNTRPRWSLACEYTCVRGWVARAGWPYEWRPRRCAPGTARRSTYSHLPSLEHKKNTRRQSPPSVVSYLQQFPLQRLSCHSDTYK